MKPTTVLEKINQLRISQKKKNLIILIMSVEVEVELKPAEAGEVGNG